MINSSLKITGMHCSSCAMNIDLDIEEIAGIVSVNTSYATAITKIEYDPQITSLAQIQQKITDLGYQSDEIKL